MNKYKILFCLPLSFFSLQPAVSGQEILDAVIAVVGDRIVLKSEADQRMQQVAMQQNIQPGSKAYEQLKPEVVDELVSQKILLIKAKKDTITVEDAQVDSELDKRIEAFIEQSGSIEKLEEAFGAPLKQIRKKFRSELRDYLIIQKVQQTKLMEVTIYPQEVESFFNSMKDSLPEKQEMVKLRHILVGIKPGGEAYNKALATMNEARTLLNAGEPFEQVAATYSEDPGTASSGGDLGFIERGDIFEEFENAAFRLKENEISEIIRTDIGLHIIKCLENRGDKVRAAHIFVKITETQEDEAATVDLISDIREQIIAGASFDSLAVLYSDDATTADLGGDIGWTTVENMQIPAFAEAVGTLASGEVSKPFRTRFGYHIVLKEDEQEKRPFSLEKDYEQLKNAAMQQKQQKVFTAWIEELKKDIHIEIKKDLL